MSTLRVRTPRPGPRIGELRPSQLMTNFGPGSIVDLPRVSAVVAGLEAWRTGSMRPVVEPRLQRALNVRYLFEASPRVSAPGTVGPAVPARVFPRFLVCPTCRLLAPVERFRWAGGRFACQQPSCGGASAATAFPVRFLTACERGHLDDFPWSRYVHRGTTDCREDLYLRDSGVSGSVADVYVECPRHGRRTLGDAFDVNRRRAVIGACTAARPWLGIGERDTSACAGQPRVLLRGASNVFFPVARSALAIPPWSSPLHEAVARRIQDFGKVDSLESLRDLLDRASFDDLAQWPPESIWDALRRQRGIGELSDAEILDPEWEALRAAPTLEPDFETEVAPVPDAFADAIDSVVLVHRLREVRVLRGFARVEPLDGTPADAARMMPLSNLRTEWLPAVEVRGEGVFLQFRSDAVRAWEARTAVRRLAQQSADAYANWRAQRGLPAALFIGLRYVMLHTVAHVLIRQLGLDCGYGAGSIRERIYAGSVEGSPMAAILLYTGSTDADGSLGGLVELGRPDHLGRLLADALLEAGYCASDPLCAEGRPGLKVSPNGAACHACLLASETSCENNNRLLDRAALVPTVSTADAAFFA